MRTARAPAGPKTPSPSLPHLHDAVLPARHEQPPVLAPRGAVRLVLEARDRPPHLPRLGVVYDHLRGGGRNNVRGRIKARSAGAGYPVAARSFLPNKRLLPAPSKQHQRRRPARPLTRVDAVMA